MRPGRRWFRPVSLLLLGLMLFGWACARRPEARPSKEVQASPMGEAATRVGYTIQVGAFANPENAARLAERLQAQGLEATHFLASKQLYRVRFGDFPTREAARKRAEALKQAGSIEDFYVVAPEEQPVARLPKTGATGIRHQLVETARNQLGVPYLWGGASRDGFDCSGLAMTVYRVNGLRLPRSSREQFGGGRPVASERLQEGDLVFFSTDGSGRASHVGVYVGSGNFIHAPGRGRAVCRDELSDRYFRSRYLGARSYL